MNEMELNRQIELTNKINFLEGHFIRLKEYFEDKTVVEISRNQNGKIFVEKYGVGYIDTGQVMTDIEAESIIKVVASFYDTIINRDNPILEARLPNGARFEGVMYEAVDNHPVISIRKNNGFVVELEEYLQRGAITQKQKEFLVDGVLNKKYNILISGGTGTGKTTFLNSCLQVLNGSHERIHIIEEVKELKLTTSNSNFFETTKNTGFVELLRANMRLNVDRIMLGELRSGAATIELLKAWNSGHPGGLSTIHANSNQAALQKLEQYLGEVSLRPQQAMITEAVDVVVNMYVASDHTRKVREIAFVRGYDREKEEYILEVI